MDNTHPKEVAVDLELDLDEEDVVREVDVAPSLNLLEAHREAVARRHRVQHGEVKHKPPGKATNNTQNRLKQKQARTYV